jgi:hypothetical protein
LALLYHSTRWVFLKGLLNSFSEKVDVLRAHSVESVTLTQWRAQPMALEELSPKYGQALLGNKGAGGCPA